MFWFNERKRKSLYLCIFLIFYLSLGRETKKGVNQLFDYIANLSFQTVYDSWILMLLEIKNV